MKKNLAPIWKNIAEVISAQVSRDTFHRWFQAIELLEANEDELMLGVPNNIYQLWIESNYMPLVHSAIESVLGAPRLVRFSVDHDSHDSSQEENEVQAHSAHSPREAEMHVSQNGFSNGSQPAETAHEVSAAPAAVSISATAANSGMNPRNTFETFVVGKNSEYAHAAALGVAKEPAKKYNPLFIHGGVGLGKTHLMHAIGQHILAHGTGRHVKVIYLSSEKFTNEFIDAIQNNALVKFRKRYRQADVLLIDDIQFLAGKERSQEEFFHTFNALFDGHKQIVLSSDRPPSEISNLEARMVSRFEWGMTAHLQPPEVETRMAILRKKALVLQIKLDDEVFEFLANRIRTNVRRLEGALMRVASFASLDGRALTPEIIEHLLKDILQEERRQMVTIEQIQRKVAEHFDVRLADMTSKRRPASIAFPRQVAMYLARELTKASLNEIGDAFGGRDHGTVLHACKLVKKRMKEQDNIRQTISFIDSALQR